MPKDKDNPQILIIRDEIKNNEFRTPIVPSDISKLNQYGFNVLVESSQNRSFKDYEYQQAGAQIIPSGSWVEYKSGTAIIIGLKEIDKYEQLDGHVHIYFSHFFKSKNPLLHWFKSSRSLIYDLEFLRDNQDKRCIAFGFYAGYIGSLLGLLYHTNELKHPLSPWKDEPEWINKTPLSIALIGSSGNCGRGSQLLLSKYNSHIKITSLNRNDPKLDLYQYDLIINCIFLNEYIPPFITSQDLDKFNKKTTIVDISCDPNHIYNPLPIYNQPGTWENCVIPINSNVSVISLDNLPSLLPRQSSIYFSNILQLLLSDFDTDSKQIWNRAKQFYLKTIEL
jgi:saccharopine dehydrogenase (NAD+, L-lysine-forming)